MLASRQKIDNDFRSTFVCLARFTMRAAGLARIVRRFGKGLRPDDHRIPNLGANCVIALAMRRDATIGLRVIS